ncbi:hypothetical protein JB92DRAFT_2829374 [Gautieria morchelliformis]|nr:hypothetical protein JB92DRAFT_2829374 [Gautieria morchelliformis]
MTAHGLMIYPSGTSSHSGVARFLLVVVGFVQARTASTRVGIQRLCQVKWPSFLLVVWTVGTPVPVHRHASPALSRPKWAFERDAGRPAPRHHKGVADQRLLCKWQMVGEIRIVTSIFSRHCSTLRHRVSTPFVHQDPPEQG